MNKLEIKQQIFNKLYELYVPEEQFTEESALKLITEYSALKGVNICSKSLNDLVKINNKLKKVEAVKKYML